MKQKTHINHLTLMLAIVATLVFWQCDKVNDPVNSTDDTITQQILALITSEDSLYEIDDMGDADAVDFGLGKMTVESAALTFPGPFDSTSIWRFHRSEMNRQRQEPEVTVVNDSLSYATLSDHVTGIFHVLQRERVWTSDSTWTVGDTLSYTEKPIDMLLTRHVRFEYLPNLRNVYHWMRTGMTPVYGGSVNGTLDFTRLTLRNLVTDSVRTMTDFENTYISVIRRPLEFARQDTARLDLFVLNSDNTQPEWVRFKWDFNRMNPITPSREMMRYVGTNTADEKQYAKVFRLMGRDRVFKAYLEAVDSRTLFDPTYTTYNSQILGFHYLGRPPRHL